MGASVKLRLAALAAICNAESSLWVPHALRRMSAPGREPNLPILICLDNAPVLDVRALLECCVPCPGRSPDDDSDDRADRAGSCHWRPLVKGRFEAVVKVSGAVMSSAF